MCNIVEMRKDELLQGFELLSLCRRFAGGKKHWEAISCKNRKDLQFAVG